MPKNKKSCVLSIGVLAIANLANAAPISTPPDITVSAPITYDGGTVGAGSMLTIDDVLINNGGLSNFGTINNNAAGTFINSATRTFNNNSGATFSNAGTLTNSGYYSVNTGSTFTNTGTINNQSAALFLFNEGTLGGTVLNSGFFGYYNAANTGNATITNNASLNLRDGSSLGSANITNNSGILFYNSATAGNATIINNGTLNIRDGSSLGSANITNNPSSKIVFREYSNPGSATIINAGTITNYGLNATIESTGNITNNAVFLNDRTLSSTGVFTNSSSGTFVNAATRTFNNNSGGTFTNTGTTTNDGTFTLATGSVFANNTGSTFTNSSGSTFTSNITLNNSGTFTVASGSTFSNLGTINNLSGGQFNFNTGTLASTLANTGTFNFANASSAGASNITNNPTGILNLGNTSTFGNAAVNNAGTINVSSTAASIGVNGSLVNTGTIANTGTLTNSGELTNNPSGIFNNANGSIFTNNSTLTNSGTLTAASGSTFTNNSTINNNLSGQFNIDNIMLGGNGTINNNGTISFLNNANAGLNTILNNASGILNLVNLSSIDDASITNLGTINFSSSAGNIGANGSVVSTGTFSNSGTLSNVGTFTNSAAATFNNQAGKSFTNTAGSTFTNTGNLNNSGLFTVNAASTFTSTGAITNAATGQFDFNNVTLGGTIANSGIVNLANGSNAGSSTITNNASGTLTFADTSNADSAVINNDGTIDFSAATNALTGGYTGLRIDTLNGSGTISGAGKTLSIGQGTYAGTLGAMDSLVKNSAVLTLTGNNSAYAGNVIVNSGEFRVGTASSISALLGNGTQNLTVNSGAAFGGYGSSSFDTATFNTGSKYIVGLSPSTAIAGKLNANTININAGTELQVETVSPTSDGKKYIIASYNNLNGTFDTVTPIGIVEITDVDYGNANNKNISLQTRGTSVLADITSSIPIADVVFALPKREKTSSDEISFIQRAPTLANYNLGQTKFSGKIENEKEKMLMKSLTQSGLKVMDRDTQRVWIIPYYVHTRSDNLNAKASYTDNEGLIFGYEKRDNKAGSALGVTTSFGLGQNESPSTLISQNNKITSKVGAIGAYYTKEINKKIELGAIIHGALNHHESTRYGNPLPGTIYQAKSKYNSKSLSADLRGSWKYVVNDRFSLRPNIGLTLDSTERDKHSEKGAGIYNQTYLKKKIKTYEPYAGMGMRHKWKLGEKEYKITGIYEHGYDFGDNDTIIKLTTPLASTVYNIDSRGSGRHADYFTVYGSVLNGDNSLKLMLGYVGTLKKYSKSHAVTLKVEKRF